MASPNQTAVVAIVNQVSGHMAGGFTSNNDVQINNNLNASNAYPNPIPQDYVYGTYTAQGLLTGMNSGLLNTLMYIPDFGSAVINALNIQPKTLSVLQPVVDWLTRCSGANILSTQIYLAATGFLLQTFPDQYWNSGISWAQYNLYRTSDLFDISISRGYYDVLVGIPPTGVL
jgi:hypothetical protein